jgi:hypothetical protein
MDPPLWIQICSSSLKPIQILPRLCHGGNLKLGRDIGQIFVSWMYIMISPNNTSTGTVINWRQPWTSLQQSWIYQFFVPRADINHPNFIAQHPHTMWMWKGDKRSPHRLFFIKSCPSGKVTWFRKFSRDKGSNSTVLAPHRTHRSQRHPWSIADVKKYQGAQNGKKIKYQLIVACNEWIYFYFSLITQLVSPACSWLLISRHSNQPFGNARGWVTDWDWCTVWGHRTWQSWQHDKSD